MPDLAPLRIRVLVIAVLIGLALISIWLIDRRAIQRMDQARTRPTHQVGQD